MLVEWIVGAGSLYLLWQQNQIFRQQNKIFARQAGETMPPDTEQQARLKRYWPLLVMTILTLANIGGIGFTEFQKQNSFPPEFDVPDTVHLLTSYGLDTPNSCFG